MFLCASATISSSSITSFSMCRIDRILVLSTLFGCSFATETRTCWPTKNGKKGRERCHRWGCKLNIDGLSASETVCCCFVECFTMLHGTIFNEAVLLRSSEISKWNGKDWAKKKNNVMIFSQPTATCFAHSKHCEIEIWPRKCFLQLPSATPTNMLNNLETTTSYLLTNHSLMKFTFCMHRKP